MIEAAIRAVTVMVGVLGVWLFVQTVRRRVVARDAPEQLSACSGWSCHLCQEEHQDTSKVEGHCPESDTSDHRKGTRHETSGL